MNLNNPTILPLYLYHTLDTSFNSSRATDAAGLRMRRCPVNSGQLSSAGSQKESGKMHHTRGVKRPAGMGGPHCDHSPSSLICSHYPDQHLKIKNKDRESDGGRREAASEREWGKWVKEGGTKTLMGVCVCVHARARASACVYVCVDCHLPLFGGCRWQWCWGVGGVGRRVDKGDSTLKPTKLQKQWILNSRLNSRAYVKHYCIIILDLSPMGRRFELEQQGPVRTIFAPCDNCPARNWKSYRELLPFLLLGGLSSSFFFFLPQSDKFK